MAEAHAEHETREGYRRAYLTALAVTAGTHGSKEAWKALEEGMKPRGEEEHDPRQLAALFNVPMEEISRALAQGWRPPRVRVG